MADNTIRTVLKIDGENSYKKSLAEINSVLKGLDSEVAVLNAQYGKNATSMTALTERQTQLTARLDVQQKKLELVRVEYERVSKEQSETSEAARKLQREYNYASAQFERTTQALEVVGNQIKQNNVQVEEAVEQFQEMSEQVENTNEQMEQSSSRIQRVRQCWKELNDCGQEFSEVGLKMVEEMLTKSVKDWMELTDAMADVGTIADVDAKNLKELTDEVMAVSDATGVEATEIARAQYQAIDANVATADSAYVVENAAKAAKVGVMELSTTLSSATNILDIWKISAADSEKVFTALLTAQKRGKTTVEELSDGIGDIAGLVPQVNMSLNETLAVVSTLTQRGIKTENVFAMLQEVMENVITPSEDAAELSKELGLQFDATALKSKGFAGFLADVMEKTKGSTESLVTLFGSLESASQIMMLAGDSAGLYADILNDVTNSAGSLDSMFEQRMSSSTERFSAALNKVNNAAIRLGESLAPYIEIGADITDSIANAISNMDAAQGKNIITTALWVTGIGKTVSVAGKLIASMSSIIKTVKTLGALLGASSPVLVGLGAVGAAIAGIIALQRGVESTQKQLQFRFDTSELEKYKVDPKTLENPITVNATAQLKVKNDLAGIHTELVRWLSDGLPETEEEKAEFAKKVNAALEGTFKQVEDCFEEKKKALTEQFNAGIIDQETYTTSLATLEGQAASYKADLTEKADAVNSYVATLVAANRKITNEEIGHLRELLAVLGETASAVLEANNVALQTYKAAYYRVAQGVGTEEDQKVAAEYIEMMYATDKAKIDSAKESTSQRYDAMMTAEMSKEELGAVEGRKQAELAKLDALTAELNNRRLAQYYELSLGVAEAEQKKANLDAAMSWMNLDTDEYGKRMRESPNIGMSLKSGYKITKEPFETLVGSAIANGATNLDGWQALAEMQEAYNQDAQEFELSSERLAQVATEVSSTVNAVGQAVTENNDVIEGLPETYEEIGDNMVDSLVMALKQGEFRAYAAGYGLGKAAERGGRAGIRMNSPSKAAQEIAQNFAGTLSDELLKGVPKVQMVGKMLSEAAICKEWDVKNFNVNGSIARLQREAEQFLASSRVTTNRASAVTTDEVRQSAASSSAPTIVNNINYTAGAGTRREARRLNQMLAWEQKAALAAEGL